MTILLQVFNIHSFFSIRNCFGIILWHLPGTLHVQQFIRWFTYSDKANFWAVKFLSGEFHFFIHRSVNVHLSQASFRFVVHHHWICKFLINFNEIKYATMFYNMGPIIKQQQLNVIHSFALWLVVQQIFIHYRFCWILDANPKFQWIFNICYFLLVWI